MTTNAETSLWLRLAHLQGVGLVRLHRALEFFRYAMQELFAADEAGLIAAGLPASVWRSLQEIDASAIEAALTWAEQPRCHIVTYNDAAYPGLLKELVDPPLLLFVQGDTALLQQPQIAIVGSRNPTPGGRDTALRFAIALARAGLVVTSGLALGIDAASHAGALSIGAPTLAVLGTGLHTIYPASHRALANSIIAQGALVSEFPLTMPPKAQNFPRRNRLISGLTVGTLVIEAALRSGSLITARYAAEQGREVFAIPGSIHNPLAKGCHQLIHQGAKLCETSGDILSELGMLQQVLPEAPDKNSSTNFVNLDKKHSELLEFVGYEATSLDSIIAQSGLTVSQVSSMLLQLELKSYVNLTPGGYLRMPANSR